MSIRGDSMCKWTVCYCKGAKGVIPILICRCASLLGLLMYCIVF